MLQINYRSVQRCTYLEAESIVRTAETQMHLVLIEGPPKTQELEISIRRPVAHVRWGLHFRFVETKRATYIQGIEPHSPAACTTLHIDDRILAITRISEGNVQRIDLMNAAAEDVIRAFHAEALLYISLLVARKHVPLPEPTSVIHLKQDSRPKILSKQSLFQKGMVDCPSENNREHIPNKVGDPKQEEPKTSSNKVLNRKKETSQTPKSNATKIPPLNNHPYEEIRETVIKSTKQKRLQKARKKPNSNPQDECTKLDQKNCESSRKHTARKEKQTRGASKLSQLYHTANTLHMTKELRQRDTTNEPSHHRLEKKYLSKLSLEGRVYNGNSRIDYRSNFRRTQSPDHVRLTERPSHSSQVLKTVFYYFTLRSCSWIPSLQLYFNKIGFQK